MKNLDIVHILKQLRKFTFAFFCLCGPAWVINQLLIPKIIICGELSGLCEIIYFISNFTIKIWLSSLILNIFLLSIAINLMGWKFCLKTIFGILTMSFWFKIIPIPEYSIIDNSYLCVIVAALLNGIGLGFCFLQNANSGGTDIIGFIVSKYKNVNIGNVLFCCDFLIICSSWFLPQVTSIQQIMLGLLYTFTSNCCVNFITNNRRLKSKLS